MSTLYIDRRGVSLDLEGEALVFREGGERIGTVPLAPLKRVFIRGGVTVNTSLLARLGAHGIGVVLLSGKKAQPTLILPQPHNDAQRRLTQYRAAQDDTICLKLARRIVGDKLAAQMALLHSKLESRLDARYELTHAIRALTGILGQVDHKATLPELRGLEGAAANLYFSALGALVPKSLGFQGRNRRPPRDPVNAVLSLTYTLLHTEAVLAAHSLGLDPYVGFFHAVTFARESLACDLIEPLRADADAFTLALFNRQELRKEDFTQDQTGCLLGKAGRGRYYRAYEGFAEAMRKKLEAQVWELVGFLNGGEQAEQPREEGLQ